IPNRITPHTTPDTHHTRHVIQRNIMSLAPDRLSATHRPASGRLGLRRLFTSPGVDPYDEVVWERRDARITNWKDGAVAFEQLGVEFPTSWSVNATNIVSQKYFRGTPGTPERESSLK